MNLFIASELNWAEKGFRLRQETKFPEVPATTLTVSVEKPVQLAMRLRVPNGEIGDRSKINGKAIDARASPGSYLTISRTWKNGDRVEMALPMRLRIETMPDDPKMQAVLYGPIVLAGDLGNDGLTKEMIVGPNAPSRRRIAAMEIPAFRATTADPASWIKAGDKPLTFSTTGQPRDVTLAPISSIMDKRYSVYWQVG